jgi:hypothetical protein
MPADYPVQPPLRGAVWLARATASGLCAAARLNVAGLILAVLNLHVAAATAPGGIVYPALGAASLLGATQLYLLVRIEIDRRLFDALAMAPDAGDLAALDFALTILGWASQARNNRSLEARSCGAIRFMQSAGALAGLQLVTTWLFILLR